MKRFIRLATISFVLVFFLSNAYSEATGPGSEETLFKANQAYKEGRFQDAVNGYVQLAGDGHASGHLYYNLGNAYFRLNELGRAILFYERARLFIPRDADLKFNLHLARNQTRDALPTTKSFIGATFFWLDGLNLYELFWGLAVLNVLFFCVLIMRLFYRPEWSYYILVLLLIFGIVGATSFGVKWYQIITDDRAVVLAKELDVLAGPDPQDTLLFKLHAGSIVTYERAEDRWSLIRLSEEKRGWVGSQDIETIAKHERAQRGS
jgi:tetratricopeptide (TPR) repeat protein